MSECSYCRHSGGKHNVACPESMSGPAKVLSMTDWRAGYRHGRSGKSESTEANSSYRLGYGEGIVAREEAENGYDPRLEQ